MHSLFATRRTFLGTLGAAAASSIPSFARKQAVSPPNLLLLLADEVPAGSLGCYGSTGHKTPNLDAMARRGVRFQNALASSRGSASGRATLLSGRTPLQHGINGASSSASLQSGEVLLTDLLAEEGYDVGYVGAWGLGNDKQPGHGIRWSNIQSGDSAAAMIQPALQFLDQQKSETKPFFLTLSYTAPADLIDNQLPTLLSKLRERRLEDNTLIVFTSAGCTPESLRVPLVFSWPGHTPVEARPPELAGSYDFLPTLCDSTAATAPDRNLCGRSYLPLVVGKTFPKKAPWKPMVYGSFGDADTASDNRFRLILRDGGKGANQLFDMINDPKQGTNQFSNRNFVTTRDELRHNLLEWKTKYSKS